VSAADLQGSVARYRELAPRYDHFTRRIDAVRERAIGALGSCSGAVVLDAGCGTGWCLPRIAERVGVNGRVVGFDSSPEMLALARARAGALSTPVDLLLATGEEARLPMTVDAILFSYTHDLLRSPRALDNLLGQAKRGARVAATSTKLYARWLFPANWYLRHSHRDYITNFEGFDAPWSLLAERLDGFRVETSGWTQHYVAVGCVRR
jgi:demethylmenaquinone methyltransferase/2-methoxy-6-polyprenyl-1,4-benzoquinol methylase